MNRIQVVIRGSADRARLTNLIAKLPFGSRVEVKQTRRSVPQNDRMWAMLTDVSRQLEWHGQRLRAEDWKLVFLDALKREVRVVPSINGDGFVSLGWSSSDLSKDEMSELIDLIAAFGAQHGVVFGDEAEKAA